VIAGTVPALLTPFATDGSVDHGAAAAHVAWLRERGVLTISPLGTTGEGPSLSLAERKRAIDRLAAHPSGMQLLPGTGCTALPETIELSRHAIERGSAGILIAPPSFYDATAAGTTRYYDALLAALPDEARVFLYHIPAHTGVPIEDETLRALIERHGPKVAGAKDSGRDRAHAAAWVRDFPGLTILPGSDANVARAYASGAPGTITMLANLVPEELEGIRAGDAVEERQRFLVELRALVGDFPRLAALKHLLHVVTGLPRTSVRPPLDDLTGTEAEALEARFHELRSEIHV
jgi:4-hydroxy-tetrahydrodipicolinate synthase